MIYKGEEYKEYSKIIDKAFSLKGKEQQEFVDVYLKSGPYAAQNIGYISGYYDAKTANKIMKVFKTSHPIFGGKRNE